VEQRKALQQIRQGEIAPVYVLYGQESFLVDEVVQALKVAILMPETADFNESVHLPGPDQLSSALQMAQTPPFFGERRLVWVKEAPFFSAKRKKGGAEESDEEEGEAKGASGDEEALLRYLKEPIPTTCLVFLAGESVDSRKKTTKAVGALDGLVECQSLKPEDAAMWAQTRATSAGKKLAGPAAALLVEKLGSDLRLIDMELQKLALYASDQKEIDRQAVDLLVGGVAETEIFRLTEAVVLKQRPRAMQLLDQVLRQVDHPLQVLAALTNRFRQILQVKALQDRHLPPREAAALIKMHPFAYDKLSGTVRRFARDEILTSLCRLLEADLAIKSGAEPRLTLEALVVELMG
jgi:DNA polymerase-3 subunit delta